MPAKFVVDTRKAGSAPLDVKVFDSNLNGIDQVPLPEKPKIRDNGDGTYEVSYIPPKEGSHLETQITYNRKDIPHSPFGIKVRPLAEPEKVKLSGPSITDKGVPASLPTTVKIDTNDAGYGDLEVKVVVSRYL